MAIYRSIFCSNCGNDCSHSFLTVTWMGMHGEKKQVLFYLCSSWCFDPIYNDLKKGMFF